LFFAIPAFSSRCLIRCEDTALKQSGINAKLATSQDLRIAEAR
jgi:hypothetical protein